MYAVTVLAAIITVGSALYILPLLVKWSAIRSLRRWCRRNRVVVLTFDDGPGDVVTPRVLNLLERHRARATFFVTAASAAPRAGLLRHIHDGGHELGCHSAEHTHAWRTSPWRSLQDMTAGYHALRDHLRPSAPFRPPYGKLNLVTMLVAWFRGYRLAWWTVDSGDTWDLLPESRQIVDKVAADGGGVVLMHDFHRAGTALEARTTHVLAVTQGVLELARVRGWAVVRFSDLFAQSDQEVQLSFHR